MRREIAILACLLCLHGQTALAQDGRDKVTLAQARKIVDAPLERQLPEDGAGVADLPGPPPPMPDYISDKPVKLTAKERKALELAEDWAAKSVTPSRDGNGRVLYVHGASLPTVIASPFQVCDVELQPGETLNEVVVGDSARWLVDVSKSGSGEAESVHLLIKPVDAGLETSAVVTTNRRVYHLRLVSQRSGHTPYIGFTYQEDHVRHFKEQAAKDAKEKLWRTASVGGQDMDLSKLHFGYGLKGRAAWKPTQVYDDGRQTFIRLPDSTATGEMPILLVRKASGNVLVNYRVKERTMVMDGLFDRVLLIVGVGSDQEKIEITREKS